MICWDLRDLHAPAGSLAASCLSTSTISLVNQDVKNELADGWCSRFEEIRLSPFLNVDSEKTYKNVVCTPSNNG